MKNTTPKSAKRKAQRSFIRENLVILIMALTAIFIIVVWLYNMKIGRMPDYCDIGEVGQFGDRFGFSTSLFGGITIILLLITIHLQRNEIEEGKKEFRKQNRTLSFQRFETTFFNMVNLLNEITDSKRPIVSGHVAAIYSEITRQKSSGRTYRDIYYSDSLQSNVQEEHEFVRTFTRIVEHIYDNKKRQASRAKYMQILLSQLNQYETLLLYYSLLLTKSPEPFFEESSKIIRAELNDIGYGIEAHLKLTEELERNMRSSALKN